MSVTATVARLESAFHVYFDEIERCRRAEAYWALLYVLVSLPDICGALESENGWATEKKYLVDREVLPDRHADRAGLPPDPRHCSSSGAYANHCRPLLHD